MKDGIVIVDNFLTDNKLKYEKIKVESKKNRCVIFRGDLLHQAVTADDSHRIVLNMNLLNREVIEFYQS